MKKLFLLLLTTFLLIGCSSEDDNLYDYIGTWSGTYSGSEKGTWNIVVGSDGKVTGTMHSEPTSENYYILGTISTSGEINAAVGNPSDGEFKGNLNTEKTGNGTWRNSVPTPDRSGSWTGSKE